MLVFLRVEIVHSLLDLVHTVKFESFLTNWVDKFFQLVIKHFDRLLYLLLREQVLKVILSVVFTNFVFIVAGVFFVKQ